MGEFHISLCGGLKEDEDTVPSGKLNQLIGIIGLYYKWVCLVMKIQYQVVS